MTAVKAARSTAPPAATPNPLFSPNLPNPLSLGAAFQGSRVYRLLKADPATILAEKNAFFIFAEV